MPLGTLDRTPPPFFRQGPSALSKLLFFSALSLFLMIADTRMEVVQPLRSTLAVALLPLQHAAMVPVEMLSETGAYLQGLAQARESERAAREQLAAMAEQAALAKSLAHENERLRALLTLRPALQVRSQSAQVMYEAADPFSRKIFIDRGRAHGVVPASPVINEVGVLGQVTQVYALTSEVTLLADKDAAIPVLNERTQQRSAAFGGTGGMELRFMSGIADVQAGDLLQTSGLDGVYPPGLAVARVTQVQRRVDSGFARVALEPVASPDGVRHVLVLEPLLRQLPPRPEAADAEPDLPRLRPRSRPGVAP